LTRIFPAKRIAGPLVISSLLLCGMIGGCQILGAIVGKAQGAPPVDALFVPKKVPTLVLAEHAPASGVDDVSSEDIGRRTADFWNDQKVSPLIDVSKLEELRVNRPDDYYKMSTVAIGRALGAEQVLYIDVRDSHDESAGGTETIRAKGSVRVRLIEVATGQTLWPPDAARGYTVDAETAYGARGDGISESEQMEQVRAMLADKIVKLFYKHTEDTQ
jgi:hypothetical protein